MIRSNGRQPIGESRLWQLYDRRRFAILFYALLFTLLVLPVATTIGLPPWMIRLFLAVCLATAVMPNSNKHTRLIFLAVIVLLSVAGEGSERGFLPVSQALILLLVAAIGLLAAVGTFRFMLASRSVTDGNRLCRAQHLSAGRLVFRADLLVDRTASAGQSRGAGSDIANEVDLLQLRHARDAWLRRFPAAYGCCPRARDV